MNRSDRPVTAAGVNAALATRFAAPEWSTIFDVGNATGFAHCRRADALSMNLWPSRGLELHGFEVKVSRHDWIREKDNPEKSAVIQKSCDRWWLVLGDESLIAPGELPATWGLLVLQGRKLVQKVEAPRLEAEPWSRPFIAAMLRAATKGVVPTAAVEVLVEERAEKLKENNKSYAEQGFERTTRELETLRARVAAFEEASGVDIDARYAWHTKLKNPKTLGEAVKFILTRGLDTDHLQGLLNSLDATRRELLTAIETAKDLPVIGDDKVQPDA